MAIYRTVQISFWTDTKVMDDFTPEDKYFYLYLMTNPHTNLAGCYEISMRQVEIETGYNRDTIEKLIERLEKVHEVVKYSKATKEILILNWSSYNWTRSKDFQKPLLKEIESIKSVEFKTFLFDILDNLGTVLRPSKDGVETNCLGTTVTVTDTNNINNNLEVIKEIISYLNNKVGSKYRYQTKATQEMINARLKEGYIVDDFKTVIDNKCAAWLNDKKMSQFLRPETLFRPSHFESYLNEKPQSNGIDWKI